MAKWQDTLDSITPIWEMYEQGLDFQASQGLSEQIRTNIDFFEGRQWPAQTENTKNLPRPVVNIVKMICRSKKAAILSSPLRLIFKSYTQGVDVSKFNSFASSLLKELSQDALDRRAVDDGVKKGSYFYHYYWDRSALSPFGKQDGSIRCELIDPLNIYFECPSELDEQKQKWIIIATEMTLNDAISLADSGTSTELIYKGATENGKITVLTRYFRIGAEVYFEKGTKFQMLCAPKPLAPTTAVCHQGCAKAHLYPIVCGYYEKKEGSIYGISEIEGLIPNQKAINFNIAMSLLNAQECAWGKYIALPNALKGQKISNVPGQVLIDHSGTGNGIKKMPDQAISEIPMNISSSLISITRSISGASELLSGEAISTSLSGTAIAQLQAQAQLPIEDLRSEFIEVKRKQGLVLAQLMKLYFSCKEFISEETSNGKRVEIIDSFSSSDYEGCVFDAYVEVTNSSRATVAADISFLNSCLESGKIDLKTYIQAYPDCAISNKSELLSLLEAEQAQSMS